MTSHVRVFGKSLHWLAAGWLAAIIWLWVAQIQRGRLLDPEMATNFHWDTIIAGVIPAVLLEVMALVWAKVSGSAPTQEVGRREWLDAFLWSFFPNLMILYTVHLMILGEI